MHGASAPFILKFYKCNQAGAFSSRNSRRNIFPTLVLGSSFLNSMSLGRL